MNNITYIFLGGVPKSGTSSLFEMLGEIPEISPSIPKETFYLIDKDYIIQKEENYFEDGWSKFNDFFAKDNKKIRLEGTTHLIYQEDIIPVLKEKKSFFIFILRRPEERIRSSFEYSMNNLASFNKRISFPTFVDIFLDSPKDLLQFSSRKNALSNLAQGKIIADYPRLISKWKSQIPEDRLFIIDYDFYNQKPQETLNKLMERISPEVKMPEIAISRSNKTKHIKNIRLHNWLGYLNRKTQNSLFKKTIKKIYFKFQKKKVNRTLEDEKALIRLKNAFDFNYKELCDNSFKIK